MSEDVKRKTSKCKSSLVIHILKGHTTISEASRQYDSPCPELESWTNDAKKGMQKRLRSKPIEF